MDNLEARQAMVRYAHMLYAHKYAVGSAGNMSMKLDDGTFLATPTGSSFGFLNTEDVSHIDASGNLLSGKKPTKEIFFHLVCYEVHPDITAVVHLHATYATLLASCEGLADGVPIKPFTPYFVMKVGAVGILPYRKPGDPAIADDVREKRAYTSLLMANHGFIVCGKTLADAVSAAEEFEETAKLWYLGQSLPIRYLTEGEMLQLNPNANAT